MLYRNFYLIKYMITSYILTCTEISLKSQSYLSILLSLSRSCLHAGVHTQTQMSIKRFGPNTLSLLYNSIKTLKNDDQKKKFLLIARYMFWFITLYIEEILELKSTFLKTINSILFFSSVLLKKHPPK